jgi:hypothetical protein
MSDFRQPPWPSDRLPLVFAGGSILSNYPVSLWAFESEEGAGTSVQVIQICYLEGKVLVAVPFHLAQSCHQAHFATWVLVEAYFD